jgi:hypothetical protein
VAHEVEILQKMLEEEQRKADDAVAEIQKEATMINAEIEQNDSFIDSLKKELELHLR